MKPERCPKCGETTDWVDASDDRSRYRPDGRAWWVCHADRLKIEADRIDFPPVGLTWRMVRPPLTPLTGIA